MNYAVGCAFSLDDLFLNFKTDKLAISSEDCQLYNNDPHKKVLAKKVFRECIKLVLDDIIENNTTFELPTNGRRAEIHVTSIKGDQFKQARNRGKFKDVNILDSWFTGNQITLDIYTKGRIRTQPIYTNKKIKNKLTEYTNKGKQYC